MDDVQDGYKALCTACRAEVGPQLDVLPRARLTANANGDLVMRIPGPTPCPGCGGGEVEIFVAPAARPARPQRAAVVSGRR